MQFSAIRYPSINTKLKAMYSKKLKYDDFLELSKQPDSEKALLFLKNKREEFKILSDNAERIEIETQLDKNLIKDIQKIQRLLPKKSQNSLKVFLSKYEIKCIKSVFRKLYSGSIINENLNNIKLWTENIFKRIDGINNVNDFEEFLYILRKTPYFKVFKNYQNEDLKKINIFKVENELDTMCFKYLMKYAKKQNNSVLKDMIGSQIDLQNITWIYRTKTYFNFSKEDIEKTLIGYFYKINKKDISNLIDANSYSEFEQVLRNTAYKKIVTDDPKLLEQFAEKYLYDKAKKYFREIMFNINFVYAYIDMIDAENNDIINIIEGIRYNLKSEELLKKLVIDIKI